MATLSLPLILTFLPSSFTYCMQQQHKSFINKGFANNDSLLSIHNISVQSQYKERNTYNKRMKLQVFPFVIVFALCYWVEVNALYWPCMCLHFPYFSLTVMCVPVLKSIMCVVWLPQQLSNRKFIFVLLHCLSSKHRVYGISLCFYKLCALCMYVCN